MTNSRRRRGRNTEKLVADYLANYWENVSAVASSLGGSDVLGIPGFDVEVKARSGFQPLEALKQQDKRKGSQKGLIIMRLNGQGEDVGEYIAIMRVKELVPLLQKHHPTEGVTRCQCGNWIVIGRECQICLAMDAMKD